MYRFSRTREELYHLKSQPLEWIVRQYIDRTRLRSLPLWHGAWLLPYDSDGIGLGSNSTVDDIETWTQVHRHNGFRLARGISSTFKHVKIQKYRRQFHKYYLNEWGLCPHKRRLTSFHYKVRQIQLSPPNLNQYGHCIATIAFDTYQELLWVGDDYVSLSAYQKLAQWLLMPEMIHCRDGSVLTMPRSWRSTLRCKLI